MTQLMYAISSSVFAAIFLISIIVYGEDTARFLAILAAMLACFSQFIAQDDDARVPSILMAYASFLTGLAALVSYGFSVAG